MPGLSFRHFSNPNRILFGDDCLTQLGAELKRAGKSRAVVFCGRTLSRSDPGLGTVQEALGDAFAGAFTGVAEQSPVPVVEAAAQMMRDVGADAAVALGGGSAIVTARAASILAAEQRPIEELATTFEPGKPPASPRLAAPKPLQLIVPTTPTTAYGKAGAAASVPDEGRRLALFDPKARAHAIFFHPGLYTATPESLVRDAALDCFALGIQGLESRRREPLAEAMLLHGLRMLRRSLPRLGQGDDQAEVRGEMMLAALLIGNGTDFTGSGLASALGHTIGARFAVPNGLVKAIVLPQTIRYNAAHSHERLGDAVEALGKHGSDGSAAALADACAAFFAELGLPSRLGELGVSEADLPTVAAEAKDDFFYFQNPRKVDSGELIALLRACL